MKRSKKIKLYTKMEYKPIPNHERRKPISDSIRNVEMVV